MKDFVHKVELSEWARVQICLALTREIEVLQIDGDDYEASIQSLTKLRQELRDLRYNLPGARHD